jgi:hypothetical protein
MNKPPFDADAEDEDEDEDEEGMSALESLRTSIPNDLPRFRKTSLNHDSLLYLARYAVEEVNDLFFMWGAYRTAGATKTEASGIVDLLETFVRLGRPPDEFPNCVAVELGVPVERRHQFPADPPAISDEERLRQRLELESENRAKAERFRKQFAEDRALELAVADALGLRVRERAEESGLEREVDGLPFEPLSDPSVSFELLVRYRLDIRHGVGDTSVLFFAHGGRSGPHIETCSDAMGSLSRAIAKAAVRKHTSET